MLRLSDLEQFGRISRYMQYINNENWFRCAGSSSIELLNGQKKKKKTSSKALGFSLRLDALV